MRRVLQSLDQQLWVTLHFLSHLSLCYSDFYLCKHAYVFLCVLSRLEESNQAVSRSATLEGCWTTSSLPSSIARAAWPTCPARAACPMNSTTSSPAPPTVFLKVWPSVETGKQMSYLQFVCKHARLNWRVTSHSCRYPGSVFTDHVLRYQDTPGVKMIVVLGEVRNAFTHIVPAGLKLYDWLHCVCVSAFCRLEAQRNTRSARPSKRAGSQSQWCAGASAPVPRCSPQRWECRRRGCCTIKQLHRWEQCFLATPLFG